MFDDIRPYIDAEIPEAMKRLAADKYFQLVSGFLFPEKPVEEVAAIVRSCRSAEEFQRRFMYDAIWSIAYKTTDGLTVEGMEKLDPSKNYLFVSNHRDIVLDAALLDLALYRSDNRKKCEMVIGDNLLVNQFTTDLFKVNGAITVRRSLSSTRDLREETLRLSRYIRYAIEQKGVSLWIAQKSGRSKDGVDNTSPAILKMLYLAYREDGLSFQDFIKRASIVPVAISYQYDPCDITKSEEQIRKLKAEGVYNVYVKKKYADVLDLVRGLRLNKGNVHIQVGNPLGDGIEDVAAAVRETDRQIHMNYKLWDTNYFAYDHLNGTKKFESEYADMNTRSFVRHYRHLKPEVRELVFREYANPVISMLNEVK